jgi:hypothetical protein
MKNKKKSFVVGILIPLLMLSSCNALDTSSINGNQLSLVAPNGNQIARNISSLKKEAGMIVAKQFGHDLDLEITDIKYYPINSNYLALVYYKLENGTIMNYGKTNDVGLINQIEAKSLVISSNNFSMVNKREYSTLLECDSLNIKSAEETNGSFLMYCSSISNCKPCQLVVATTTTRSIGGKQIVKCDNTCADCRMTVEIE